MVTVRRGLGLVLLCLGFLVLACSNPTESTEPTFDASSGKEATPDVGDYEGTPTETVPEQPSAPPGSGLASLPPVKTVNYPMDDTLRVNHVQVIGTHNSYHIAPKEGVDDWKYTHDPLDVQLEQQGVRQFELDIYWDTERKVLQVLHIPLVDPGTTCDKWTDCLRVIKHWSDRRPQHLPIFIMVEAKLSEFNAPKDLFATLESETLSVFPKDRILTPDFVRGDAATVSEAVTTKGWPTLAQARGKVLFFLLMSEERKKAYTNDGKNLHGRIMFVSSNAKDPYAAVIQKDGPEGSEADIQALVKQGFLIRTRADADLNASKEKNETRLKAAQDSGAHMLSSDHAKPRTDGYQVKVPGGTPARCNPVNAPSSCTSEALEKLTPQE
ncbi:MAG: hypothetical protein EP343_25730 [Deltaproteobacteria bacterium]|nr:MAG: hypothetical protein EP343_25730 [Deltaproteobacteria bacterium]